VLVGILALQGGYRAHGESLDQLGAPWQRVTTPEQLIDMDALIIPGGESTALLKLMEPFHMKAALNAFHAQNKPIFGTCAGMILLSHDVKPRSQETLGFIDITVERNAYGRQTESFIAHGEINVPEPSYVHEEGIQRSLCENNAGACEIKSDSRRNTARHSRSSTTVLLKVGDSDYHSPKNNVIARSPDPEPQRRGSATKQSKPSSPFEMIFIRAPKIISYAPDVIPLASYQKDIVLARQNNILVASFHPELSKDTRLHAYFLQMSEAS